MRFRFLFASLFLALACLPGVGAVELSEDDLRRQVVDLLIGPEAWNREQRVERWIRPPVVRAVSASRAERARLAFAVGEINRALAGTGMHVGLSDQGPADISVWFVDEARLPHVQHRLGLVSPIPAPVTGLAGRFASDDEGATAEATILVARLTPAEQTATLVHELLHALGAVGHWQADGVSPMSVGRDGAVTAAARLTPFDVRALRLLYGALSPGDGRAAVAAAFDAHWAALPDDPCAVHANTAPCLAAEAPGRDREAHRRLERMLGGPEGVVARFAATPRYRLIDATAETRASARAAIEAVNRALAGTGVALRVAAADETADIRIAFAPWSRLTDLARRLGETDRVPGPYGVWTRRGAGGATKNALIVVASTATPDRQRHMVAAGLLFALGLHQAAEVGTDSLLAGTPPAGTDDRWRPGALDVRALRLLYTSLAPGDGVAEIAVAVRGEPTPPPEPN